MTLVEVLVTLVIISVGLLGVAALQLTTVRNNSDAYVRAQAAVLASDMLDRMRSNRNTSTGGGPERYVIDIDDNNEPATQVGEDIASWRRMLEEQLPQGKGGIEYDPATELVTITIQWGERSAREDDRVLVFRTRSTI
jgi:type IV pilus assembly protein PilV